MPEFEALSKKILKFRHEHGESQLEFTEHCNVSHYTMSSIENVAGDVMHRRVEPHTVLDVRYAPSHCQRFSQYRGSKSRTETSKIS